MDKDKVAEILVEIGTLLELKGENPFKTRAYANAARTLEGLSEPLATLVAEKRLGEIKGIGEALEKKITELVETGKLKYYDELKASIPPGLIEMLEISGLGPKKIQALNKKLGMDSIEKLEAACQGRQSGGTRRFWRENAGEYSGRHRAPADLREQTFVERRAAGRGAAAGKFARASRCDPLQRGGQFAAVQGGHRRH